MAWQDQRIEIEEGTCLRAWREDDLDSLVVHANDAAVSHGLSDGFPFPYTHEHGRQFLSGQIVDLNAPVFAIEIDGQACGGVGARLGAGERRRGAELGYWLGRRYWGRGRMSRIVGVFAPWLMRELDLLRLQATVQDDNPASAGVLLNNGFVEEGVLHAAVFKRGQVHDLRLFAKVRQCADES